MIARKASIRGRRRRVVQLATSSILTAKKVQLFSDEELAEKTNNTVARVKQARYACSLFKLGTAANPKIDYALATKLVGKVPLNAIARAMGVTHSAVKDGLARRGVEIPNLRKGRISKENQAKINATLQQHGLPKIY